MRSCLFAQHFKSRIHDADSFVCMSCIASSYRGTGWFTKQPSIGECPRRFFDSDREILLSFVCHCEDLTCRFVNVLCFILFIFFASYDFLENVDHLESFFSAKEEKISPGGQTSGWACRTRVLNCGVYLSKTAWRFELLYV